MPGNMLRCSEPHAVVVMIAQVSPIAFNNVGELPRSLSRPIADDPGQVGSITSSLPFADSPMPSTSGYVVYTPFTLTRVVFQDLDLVNICDRRSFPRPKAFLWKSWTPTSTACLFSSRARGCTSRRRMFAKRNSARAKSWSPSTLSRMRPTRRRRGASNILRS